MKFDCLHKKYHRKRTGIPGFDLLSRPPLIFVHYTVMHPAMLPTAQETTHNRQHKPASVHQIIRLSCATSASSIKKEIREQRTHIVLLHFLLS